MADEHGDSDETTVPRIEPTPNAKKRQLAGRAKTAGLATVESATRNYIGSENTASPSEMSCAMIDKEGTLQMQSSGRWAICRPGFDPIEITSGDVFRIEVPGEAGLRRTRMEHMDGEGYYSVNGYNLRDGLRAAIGAEG
jgi:hypothetical protein